MAKRKLDDQDHSTSSQITAMDSSSSAAPRRRKSPNSDQPPPKNPNSPRLHLQFFVKMINDGKTVVLRANLRDTVEKIHRMIYLMTGIPLIDQRLIYRGKQLQLEQTLEECDVQNDAGLFLVARLRSTVFLKAWEVISDIINYIRGVCRNVSVYFDCRSVKDKLERFVSLPLEPERCLGDCDGKIDYCKIFMEARVPQALVTMYLSREKAIRESGDECIQWFVSYVTGLGVTVSDKACCAMMVMEIVRMLRVCADVADDDVLYVHCRRVFGMLLKKVEMGRRRNREAVLTTSEEDEEIKFVAFEEVFPLLIEVGKKLLNGWVKTALGPVFMDVCDFSIFLQPVLSFIGKEIALAKALGKCKGKGKGRFSLIGDEFDPLYDIFVDLLTQIDNCLSEMGGVLGNGTGMDFEQEQNGWSHYILVLKELNRITVLCPDAENWFWATMRKHKEVVRLLVVQFTTSLGDHTWLIKHKDILDFKSRRHLALLMFPTVGEEYEEFEEMLIDRSQLLAESFEYIYSAEPAYLQAGLFMEFKNEEATGPGVLREWFCLVCQAFFDQRRALFTACPLDRRRFYPNPASKVDPLHIRYFRFAGRVIALALMHKIQIGGVLDRVFFLQLAGKCVSLEDIKDTDPRIYNSCKQILEMDPEFVDSDGLGLTFVTEVEELGSRKVVELCSGGKGIVVNSKNRKEYVHLVIQQRFVTSIKEQVHSFAQGFADILKDSDRRTTFFECLELEDLDGMLHGSETEEISVQDWQTHTEYHGYKKSDLQIVWFWEIVGQLSVEQKKTLLFFWTSVKYLPVDGFRGLASKLSIVNCLEPQSRLPSSHTCFYQLCIPPYLSKAIMKERLQVITQEHIGCSFGYC